jgi:hypothetical protein
MDRWLINRTSGCLTGGQLINGLSCASTQNIYMYITKRQTLLRETIMYMYISHIHVCLGANVTLKFSEQPHCLYSHIHIKLKKHKSTGWALTSGIGGLRLSNSNPTIKTIAAASWGKRGYCKFPGMVDWPVYRYYIIATCTCVGGLNRQVWIGQVQVWIGGIIKGWRSITYIHHCWWHNALAMHIGLNEPSMAELPLLVELPLLIELEGEGWLASWHRHNKGRPIQRPLLSS